MTPRRSGLTLGHVLRNQRPTIIAAAVFIVGCVAGGASFGYVAIGLLTAVGILLGLVNALYTEFALVRTVASGEELSRRQYGASALVRILALSAIAVVLVIAFWPDGIGALFGLAVFQLVGMFLTGLPILKEMRKG